jgi:hypothetical protein
VPAPAVIPAPIAYIKVAAVKGFVVGCGALEIKSSLLTFLALFNDGTDALRKPHFIGRRKLPAEEAGTTHATHALAARRYYCEENSVFKAAACGLNDKAWNNKGSTSGSTLLLVFKIHLDNMLVAPSLSSVRC